MKIGVTRGGYGSGVSIGKHIIITNNHVVDSLEVGDTIWIEGYMVGGKRRVAAIIETKDLARDISILRIPTDITLKRQVSFVSKDPSWGNSITMVGFPGTYGPIPTVGNYVNRHDDKILISCNGFWGNSGGPVLDKSGKLIGIAHKMGNPKNIQTSAISSFSVYPTFIFICIPYNWIEDHLKENHITLWN